MSQSKNRIEQLKQKCEVHYRSSREITGGNANIWYVDKDGEKHVEVLVRDGKKHIVRLADIGYIKMKDFADKNSNQLWVLAVGVRSTAGDAEAAAKAIAAGDADAAAVAIQHKMVDGEEEPLVQHIFQFTDRDKRDLWDHGLRTAVAAALAAIATEAGKGKAGAADLQGGAGPSKFHPVKQLTLQQPRAGVLVMMKIELENSEEAPMLEVTEAECSPDDVKRLTNQFIDDHHILPTENTSLYRYIRSVVQRAQMERETAAIVEEINSQRFELMVQDPKYSSVGKLSAEDSEKIVAEANAALAKIAEGIPKRIGQHGSGATIVNTILKRNVEKMKLINEMAAKVAVADPSGPTPNPGAAAPQV